MKRRMAGVLAALLLFPALSRAQEWYTIAEIREQAWALGHWRQTYTDAYGREIAVDIAPIVPEVDAVPVLEVSPMPLDTEAIEQVYAPEYTSVAHRDEDDATIWNCDNPLTRETVELFAFPLNGGTCVSLSFENSRTRMDDQGVEETDYDAYFCGSDVDMDRAYFEGKTDMTVRDAMDTVNGALQALFPGEAVDVGLMWVMLSDNPRPYYDCMTRQLIRGIPILTGANSPPRFLRAEEAGFPIPESWWSADLIWGDFDRPMRDVRMYGDGGYGMNGFLLFREERALAGDVPLCGLDRVIASLEARIEAGHIRQVGALRFGYACFLGEGGRIVLVPVWMAECVYRFDASQETTVYEENVGRSIVDQHDYHTMLVSAQTGEFIDPIELRERLVQCPEIITWEDVQR